MAHKSRIPRMALDFFAAGLFGYFSYIDAKNGHESLSTAFKFLSGFVLCDGVNNAVKILSGNTHFIPVLERFKNQTPAKLRVEENEDSEFVPDDHLDLEELSVVTRPWKDEDLVPG